MPARPVLALLAALALCSPVRAADPDADLAKAAARLVEGVQVETLPNGLKVYLLPTKGAPVVTTMVAYKVGACDEDKDQTGLSHYLEHLLFKGTDKLLPGDIDRATQRNGGRNNAYTSEDMTVYHFDFAADRWEIALEIEADRMRNVKIDAKHEFEQEKGAVISELKGGEDQPFDLEYKAILPLLYPKANPYSHPVIGEEKHVRGATAEIIKRHYDKWYYPNNASLVVAGGFDPAAAMVKIKALFGPIPKGDLPARKPEGVIPPRKETVRKEFPSKFDVPRAIVGFNTVRAEDADDTVLDVIDSVLSRGKTSRLYKKLVEQDRLANSVSTNSSTGRYRGWFAVQLELLKGKDRAAAEGALFAELKRLAEEPVSEAELKRAKRSAIASFVFGRESVHSQADLVARTVTVTDLDRLRNYMPKLLAVSPEDVKRVAAKYLTQPQAVVVWSVPAEGKEGKGGDGKPADPKPRRLAAAAPGAAVAPKLTDAKRTVLPNGMVVITLEDRRLPIVAATASVADVTLREPANQSGVAALVGEMLEEGTPTRTGEQISTAIEDVGGDLSLSRSGGSVKVLTPDADLGLTLLFDCIQHPAFPAEALERRREQQLSTIADQETQPRNRASAAFSKLVYGAHPFGRPSVGTRAVVEKLTAEECRAFHKLAFAPDFTTVVVVGDFDTPKLLEKLTAMTAGWQKSGAARPQPPAPEKQAKATTRIVSDPTASQTHVFIGHLGVTRKDPDYHTLVVLDNVLGTGPGFTDRLSANLRDRQGLAYTVTAQIAGDAGEQPGTFTGYIGTFPDKFVLVRDGFMTEVRKIRDEPPTAEEVNDAKKYLLGGLPFRTTTVSQVAAQLLAAERYGLGFDFLDKYKAAIEAVTPAQVQAAAKKHLDPGRIVIVAVGPIDADGKPLAEAKPK